MSHYTIPNKHQPGAEAETDEGAYLRQPGRTTMADN
jgi:hypothetical protein